MSQNHGCVAAQYLVTFGDKSTTGEVPFSRDDKKGFPLTHKEAAERTDPEDPELLAAAQVVKRASLAQVRVDGVPR